MTSFVSIEADDQDDQCPGPTASGQAGGHHVHLRHRLADEPERQVDDQHRDQHRRGDLERQDRRRREQADEHVEQDLRRSPTDSSGRTSKLARRP